MVVGYAYYVWLIRVKKSCEGFRVSRDMSLVVQPCSPVLIARQFCAWQRAPTPTELGDLVRKAPVLRFSAQIQQPARPPCTRPALPKTAPVLMSESVVPQVLQYITHPPSRGQRSCFECSVCLCICVRAV